MDKSRPAKRTWLITYIHMDKTSPSQGSIAKILSKNNIDMSLNTSTHLQTHTKLHSHQLEFYEKISTAI